MKNHTTYGAHLTLRIANIERRHALQGPHGVSDLLVELIDRIGMRILAGPLTAEETGDPERRGWSSVAILYESHCAIHTYPELGEAFLDVFSCKTFPIAAITTLLTERFGDFAIVEQSLTDRGIHWGPNVEKELASWVLTRSGS